MDMMTMYNKQMELMKEMVEQSKFTNELLSSLNEKADIFLIGSAVSSATSILSMLNEISDEISDEEEIDCCPFCDEDCDFGNSDYDEFFTEEEIFDYFEFKSVEAGKLIKEILNGEHLPYHWSGKKYYGYAPTNNLVEVVFELDGRETTAKLKSKFGEVLSEASAFCDPDDFYFENIGKLIALHRLFKLGEPVEFYTLPY